MLQQKAQARILSQLQRCLLGSDLLVSLLHAALVSKRRSSLASPLPSSSCFYSEDGLEPLHSELVSPVAMRRRKTDESMHYLGGLHGDVLSSEPSVQNTAILYVTLRD